MTLDEIHDDLGEAVFAACSALAVLDVAIEKQDTFDDEGLSEEERKVKLREKFELGQLLLAARRLLNDAHERADALHDAIDEAARAGRRPRAAA